MTGSSLKRDCFRYKETMSKQEVVKVITPPDYPRIRGPVVFLAGPIQGVTPWQEDAILLLRESKHKLTIANPRRSDETWQFQFDIQVDWETHYLDRAHREGVILFWLAKETAHSCERAYAQTTRFELGEWLAKYLAKKYKIVLGIEDGFTGARYIRRRLATDRKLKGIPVFDNLDDACDKVLSYTAQDQGKHVSNRYESHKGRRAKARR